MGVRDRTFLRHVFDLLLDLVASAIKLKRSVHTAVNLPASVNSSNDGKDVETE